MKPKANYITPDEFKQIIDYVPTLNARKWPAEDIQLAFKVAYYCALRMAEVPHLTPKDFDFQRLEVHLGRTKTSSDDYAAIPRVYAEELRFLLASRHPDKPILSDCGLFNIHRWLVKIGKELGIKAINTPQSLSGEKHVLHIFRKSQLKDMFYGTHGKKANIGQVQSQARHSSPMTTAMYLKLGIEGSKEFWDQV